MINIKEKFEDCKNNDSVINVLMNLFNTTDNEVTLIISGAAGRLSYINNIDDNMITSKALDNAMNNPEVYNNKIAYNMVCENIKLFLNKQKTIEDFILNLYEISLYRGVR